MSLKEISGAVTMNGRLTEGPKCCLKECEKWCWHLKNIFEKIIRIKKQRKEFTYIRVIKKESDLIYLCNIIFSVNITYYLKENQRKHKDE